MRNEIIYYYEPTAQHNSSTENASPRHAHWSHESSKFHGSYWASAPHLFSRLFIVLLLATAACRAAAPLADTGTSPRARIHSIGLDEARWTDGFWFDRFENLRTNMLPSMGRLMEGTNYSQYLENFRIAAGLADGRPRGAPFNDGDFYKLLEAGSATLAITNDLFLARHLDRAIDVVAQAQRPDGYIHTPVLVRARLGDTNVAPFGNRNNFEM